jgi:hypothetical protein
VCAAGCDFTTIQAALNDPSASDDAVIEITDPIHTEAGVVVNKDVTIQGQATGNTVVQAHAEAGSAADRVFHIEKGATVTIKNVTIRHGHPITSPYMGGGIWNQGTLRLEDSHIRNNIAGDGGGIWNQGTLTATNSIISHNTADGIGTPGIECGTGGGIDNGGGGRLVLINSTVSHNQAAGKSGGLHIACESSTSLFNSTVSGNQAAEVGGGIFIGQLGALKLTDSTISGNKTSDKGRDVYVRGRLDYTNTVISSCVIGGPGDYRGIGIVGTHNNTLIEDNDCR